MINILSFIVSLLFVFHQPAYKMIGNVRDSVCVSTDCGEHRQGANFRNRHDPRFQGGNDLYRPIETDDL